jgi:hypothetical protein
MNFNGNQQTLDLKIYENGRYWLGANHEFISFPKTQQGIIFSTAYTTTKGEAYSDDENNVRIDKTSIKVRTIEGLRITIQFAIHFKYGVSFDNQT